RRTDFDYCVAAGWITDAGHAGSSISRRRTISVPLYRLADVEALLELPGVDWEAVRAARPGQPSPLREHARLPLSRAVLVRGFAADLAARYDTEVTARYDEDRDRWELSWIPGASGQPGEDGVRAMLRRDRDLALHARHIAVRAVTADRGSRG